MPIHDPSLVTAPSPVLRRILRPHLCSARKGTVMGLVTSPENAAERRLVHSATWLTSTPGTVDFLCPELYLGPPKSKALVMRKHRDSGGDKRNKVPASSPMTPM